MRWKMLTANGLDDVTLCDNECSKDMLLINFMVWNLIFFSGYFMTNYDSEM